MMGYVRVSEFSSVQNLISVSLTCVLKKSGGFWRIKQEFALKAKRVILCSMIYELSDHLKKDGFNFIVNFFVGEQR